MNNRQRWEYLTEIGACGLGLRDLPRGIHEKRLDELGSDGWEVVSVSWEDHEPVAVLMRRPLRREEVAQ